MVHLDVVLLRPNALTKFTCRVLKNLLNDRYVGALHKSNR